MLEQGGESFLLLQGYPSSGYSDEVKSCLDEGLGKKQMGTICVGGLTVSIFKYIYFVRTFKSLCHAHTKLVPFIALSVDVSKMAPVLRFQLSTNHCKLHPLKPSLFDLIWEIV